MATDYTEEVVESLGSSSEAATGVGDFGPAAMRWDVSIGGLDFLYSMNESFPLRRQTAQFRRERIDTEREPGEQSLENGLWIRSQASWHYGAGLSSAEPLEVNSAEARFRFYQSGGVDPWTPGQLRLLHSTASVFPAAASGQQLLGVGTGVLHAASASLSYLPTSGASAAVSWGGSNVIFSMTDTGQVYLVSDSVGIWKGNLPSGAGSKIYDKYYSTPTYSLVRWVKSRLMYAENQGIWEITNLSPSGPTLAAPWFAHPNADWRWTDFADGPTSIYASGFSRERSEIYRIGVSATTTTVTLAQPVVAAELPRGETVVSMYAYVGSFLIVGTNLGVRVAQIQSDGSLTLGPLVFEAAQVDDAVGVGSFIYCTVRDKGSVGDGVLRAGLYRINLGQTLNGADLQFAYAADLVSPAGFTGSAVSVTVAGGRVWFAVDGAGVVRESDSFVSSGWIESGRIRLGTMEKKAWRDLRLIAPNALQGSVTAKASVFGASAPSSWATVVSLQPGVEDAYGKLNAAAPGTASDLYVAFNLQSDPSCACSAVMTGYQVRAVPAPQKTELLQFPLMMFDWETDLQGSVYGSFGNSFRRFAALKAMEQTGATVTFKDFTTGEVREVYVEEVTLQRLTAPSLGSRKNAGGVCTVVLRTV